MRRVGNMVGAMAAVAVLAVTGCSGDDAAVPVPEAEFQANVNAVCTTYVDEFDEAAEELQDDFDEDTNADERRRAVLASYLRVVREEIDELQALDPPDENADEYEQFFEDFEEAADEFEELSQDDWDLLMADDRDPLTNLQASAVELGLDSCAIGDTETISEAEYQARANEICQDYSDQADRLGEDLDESFGIDASPEEVAEAAVDAYFPLIREMIGELQALAVPDENADAYDELYRDYSATLDDVEQRVADDYEELLASEDDPFADINQRAADLGLDVCGDADADGEADDDGDAPVSEAKYRAQADKLCLQFTDRLDTKADELNARLVDGTEDEYTAAVVAELLPLFREQVTALQALPLPETNADAYEDLWVDLGVATDTLERLAVEDPATMYAQQDELFADLNQRAIDLGLEGCGGTGG